MSQGLDLDLCARVLLAIFPLKNGTPAHVIEPIASIFKNPPETFRKALETFYDSAAAEPPKLNHMNTLYGMLMGIALSVSTMTDGGKHFLDELASKLEALNAEIPETEPERILH